MVGRGTLLWEGVEGKWSGRAVSNNDSSSHLHTRSHLKPYIICSGSSTVLDRFASQNSDRPTIDEVVASQYILYGRFFLSRRSTLPEFLAAAEFRFHIQSLIIPSAHYRLIQIGLFLSDFMFIPQPS